jgi:protein FAM50
MKLKKRATIMEFLDQIRKEFKELKGVSMDNILCIKDETILPHVTSFSLNQHLSFYDFVSNDARGKFGPLFPFDQSSTLQPPGPSSGDKSANELLVPSNEARTVKIAERSWYERHKSLYPANRWAPLDLDRLFKPIDLKEFIGDEADSK